MKPSTPDASQFQLPSQEEADAEFSSIVDLYNVETERDAMDAQFASITAMYDQQLAQEREPVLDPLTRLLTASQSVYESREQTIAREFGTMNPVTYLAKRALAKGDLIDMRRKSLLEQEGALGATLWQQHQDMLTDFHHETSQNKHEWILARWLRAQPDEPISFMRYVIEANDQQIPVVRRVTVVRQADTSRSESRIMNLQEPVDRQELETLATAAQQYATIVSVQLHGSPRS